VIRIVECLCPSCHSIVAGVYDTDESALEASPSEAADTLRLAVEAMIEAGHVERLCGICHSQHFHYEDRQTDFRSKDEALREMKYVQRMQNITRAMLGGDRRN
jgi:hypothetical protein